MEIVETTNYKILPPEQVKEKMLGDEGYLEAFLEVQKELYPEKTVESLREEFLNNTPGELGANYPFTIEDENKEIVGVMVMRARTRKGFSKEIQSQYLDSSQDVLSRASEGFPAAILSGGTLSLSSCKDVNPNWEVNGGFYPFIELGGAVISPKHRSKGLFNQIASEGLKWVLQKINEPNFFPFPDGTQLNNVPIAIVAHGQFLQDEVERIRHELILKGDVNFLKILEMLGIELKSREVGRAQNESTASEYLANRLGFKYVGASVTGPHLGGIYLKFLSSQT